MHHVDGAGVAPGATVPRTGSVALAPPARAIEPRDLEPDPLDAGARMCTRRTPRANGSLPTRAGTAVPVSAPATEAVPSAGTAAASDGAAVARACTGQTGRNRTLMPASKHHRLGRGA